MPVKNVKDKKKLHPSNSTQFWHQGLQLCIHEFLRLWVWGYPWSLRLPSDKNIADLIGYLLDITCHSWQPKLDRMRNMGPFYTNCVSRASNKISIWVTMSKCSNYAKYFWKVAFMSLTVLKFKLSSDLKDVKFDVQ